MKLFKKEVLLIVLVLILIFISSYSLFTGKAVQSYQSYTTDKALNQTNISDDATSDSAPVINGTNITSDDVYSNLDSSDTALENPGQNINELPQNIETPQDIDNQQIQENQQWLLKLLQMLKNKASFQCLLLLKTSLVLKEVRRWVLILIMQ